ncbi:MAG: hypothetical protein ABIH42_09650 [Planctomycetota bacterium]
MKIDSPEALVAYLDILGYSELVKSEEHANIYYSAIESAISNWQHCLEKKKFNLGLIVKKHITVHILGDAFVVVLDQHAVLFEEGDNSAVRSHILLIFLALVSFLVQDCMRQIKHLFRGAIVKGKYYQQKYENLEGSTFIFSEGLCGAHRLEKNIANMPRIIIDKSALGALEKSELGLLCREDWPGRELLRDRDGFHYLNIYTSMVDNTALADILREVVSIISLNLEKPFTPDIIGKYVWFANYHNAFIRHIIESNAPASIPCFAEIKEKRNEMVIKIPDL